MLIRVQFGANGVIVWVWRDGDEEGEEPSEAWILQGVDDERLSCELWRDVFTVMWEEYGPPTGRNSGSRLYLTVAAGDKHPQFKDSLFQ